MQTYLIIINLFLSFFIVPLLAYVIRLEKRLTRIETIINIYLDPKNKKES